MAIQNVHDMGDVIKEPVKNGTVNSSHSNGNDPYKHFVSVVGKKIKNKNQFEIISQYN